MYKNIEFIARFINKFKSVEAKLFILKLNTVLFFI